MSMRNTNPQYDKHIGHDFIHDAIVANAQSP